MLPWDFLYVEAENWVYPGALAHEYYMWDRNGRNGPNPTKARGWAFWALRGMPQTIQQCKELLKIVANSSTEQLERFEAWLILHHFMLVSQSFAPSQHDRAMTWAAEHLPRMHRPGRWQIFTYVPMDPNAFGPINPHTPVGTLNIRLATPDPSLGLVIDPWAQYILHCGCPGMLNEFYGIIFDQSFHVLRRSVWGYLLGRAIAPSSTRLRDARTVVTRKFAYLAAVPTAYIEAVAERERLNGPGYLLPTLVQQITITRIRVSQTLSPNFGQADIMNCLLANRIPVEWLTHAYPYGVQYLWQHLASNDWYHDQY